MRAITKPAKLSQGYMIQLDALRAFAVVCVMLSHFIPHNIPNSLVSANVAISEWFPGVPLFFVLSGFLITGILLRCRDTTIYDRQSLGFTLRRFYIRRSLRIIPIYYLTLVVTALMFKKVRDIFFWHLSYTTNIQVFIQGAFDQTSSHFWSLATEEQFYLIWPLVILLTPKQHLLKVIIAAICLAIVSRFGCYAIGLSTEQIYVFPLTSLDRLGLGGLLAFFTHHHNYYARHKQILCDLGLWICLPLIIFSIVFANSKAIDLSIEPTVVAIFYVWLVSRAADGFGGILGKVMELEPIVFLGKISYGLYVYHYFMNPIFSKTFEIIGFVDKLPVTVEVILKLVASLIISILSWFYIEQPINNLKHHFSYEKN
ncbi:acyltransferase [Chamaesiphon sp. VAR_69_metabat_338]|uniref:acyltransferase family protein n=1 Tax=Chamaesiphon sp. VAR_69_metabat_338 TaxID=2964704 RepID=UPI00286DC855|nr:acyltransferase [Chamaesiphon sp. VAR_69_metabat_338]